MSKMHSHRATFTAYNIQMNKDKKKIQQTFPSSNRLFHAINHVNWCPFIHVLTPYESILINNPSTPSCFKRYQLQWPSGTTQPILIIPTTTPHYNYTDQITALPIKLTAKNRIISLYIIPNYKLCFVIGLTTRIVTNFHIKHPLNALLDKSADCNQHYKQSFLQS